MATALIAFVQLVNLCFVIGLTEKTLWSSFTVDRLVHILIVAICVLIVSIPEGMPLAVSIAIAVSTEKLKDDKILIRNLEAIQTCASFHDVCVGKTGTLTHSQMKVSKVHIHDQVITCKKPDFFKI